LLQDICFITDMVKASGASSLAKGDLSWQPSSPHGCAPG